MVIVISLFCLSINVKGNIIKHDEEYLYHINNNKINITKVYPVNEMKEKKVINYNNGFYPQRIYVNNDSLIVLGSGFDKDDYKKVQSRILIYNKDDFIMRREFKVDGYIVSSELISDNLFVISQYYDNLFNYVTVTKINLCNNEYQELNYIGNVNNVYYGMNNMYLFNSCLPNIPFSRMDPVFNITHIKKINYENLDEVSNVSIDGFIGNKHFINEYQGNLRIVTINRDNDKVANYLYVLNKKLDIKIKYEINSEYIQYVNFDKYKLYISTYKDKNHLLIVDLDNPKINKTKKFPSKILFIYPYDLDRLIVLTNNKLYLINLHDLSVKYDEQLFSNNGEIYSEISYNPHKFITFNDLIVFPLSFSMQRIEDGYLKHYYRQSYRFYALDNNRFIYKVDLSNFDGKFKNINGLEIMKTFILEDMLYTVSNKKIKAYNFNDFNILNSINYKGG